VATYNLRFYRQDRNRPVEEWLVALAAREQAEMIQTLDLLEEFGPVLGMPHSRAIGEGLQELRARTPSLFLRVIYFHWFGHTYGMLHGFEKKTNQTPRPDIELANRRRVAWLARPGPRR
jgi:phage-related protein